MVIDGSAGPEIVMLAPAGVYTAAQAAVFTQGLVGGHRRAPEVAFLLHLVEVSMLAPEAACMRALAEVFMPGRVELYTQALAEVFMPVPVEAYTRALVVGCIRGRMAEFTPGQSFTQRIGAIDGIFPLFHYRRGAVLMRVQLTSRHFPR